MLVCVSDPGQVVTLSLFADLLYHQTEIDRNCGCSRILTQLLFCFHFSIVKVLPCAFRRVFVALQTEIKTRASSFEK